MCVWQELSQLRVAKVTNGGATKLAKMLAVLPSLLPRFFSHPCYFVLEVALFARTLLLSCSIFFEMFLLLLILLHYSAS